MGIFVPPAFFTAGSSIKPSMTMTSSSLTGIAIAAALMLAACADNAQPSSAEIPNAPATSEVEMSAPVRSLSEHHWTGAVKLPQQ